MADNAVGDLHSFEAVSPERISHFILPIVVLPQLMVELLRIGIEQSFDDDEHARREALHVNLLV